MQESSEALVERVLSHCKVARFTGVLRVRSREGEAELWFLSGIEEAARFGVSTGDEARARLLRATNPKFEVVPRLPNLAGGFKPGLPAEGALGEIRPVDLLRYCETYVLTCTLELTVEGRTARATYELGELKALDTDADGDQAIARMLEASSGSYNIVLSPFTLPEDVPMHVPQGPSSFKPSLFPVPGSDHPLAAAASAQAQQSLKKSQEEVKRKALEVAAARKPAQMPVPNTAVEQRQQAEAQAKAEQEAKRRAEEEARRRAEEEARRRAEEEARRRAEEEEAKRRAEEEEAKRRAEEEEAKRRAEEEAAQLETAAAEAAPPAGDPSRVSAAIDGETAATTRARSERPRAKTSEKPKAKQRSVPPEARPEPPRSGATPIWLLLIIVAVIAAGYFFVKR